FPDLAFTRDDPSSRTGYRLDITPERVSAVAAVAPLFQEIYRSLSALDGFAVNGNFVITFEAAVDPATLPASWESGPLSPVALVVCGEQGVATPWPFQTALVDEDRTVVVTPLRPFPEMHRVALAVTRALHSASGESFDPSPALTGALAGRSLDPVTDRIAP